MAATTRLTVVALALVVLTGTAVVAGPAIAQELTDDGMNGNDTSRDGDESVDDGSMAATESLDAGDMDNESMDGDAMATEDEMGTDGMTDGAMTEDGMAGETDTGGQPGFGIAVVVVALIAGAALALRRRGG